MEFKDKLICSMCGHVYTKKCNLNDKVRYCRDCLTFTPTMRVKINVEDNK